MCAQEVLRTNVGAFPLGIDSDAVRVATSSETFRRALDRVQESAVGKTVILGVDRLDYSKGIPQRLQAFEQFLLRNPQRADQVVFILVCVPSRGQVRAYRHLGKMSSGS